MILQSIAQTPGTKYVIKVVISGMTQGKLRLDNYDEVHEFTENGSYAVLGTAQNSNIVFIGLEDENGNLFNGCIDNIEVFAFSSIEALACSPCINVQSEQDDCLLLMTAEGSGSALNFDWTDLVLKARVKAKFARGDYDEQRESLDDNAGDFNTVYFDGKKNRDLLVDVAPLYIHDFLFMCRGVETFKINGVEYVFVDDKYPRITWNTSMTEGTVELRVRKKNNKLNRTNCG